MPVRSSISLAECAWTVRAARADAIVFPPGAERGCRPKEAAYEEADFREDLARGVPARVPGCVHQALIEAGLIESPDFGDAEERLQWVGMTEWVYRCEFELSGDSPRPGERIELMFDGLDTVAEVLVNGRSVGNAASFFVPWRYDVRDSIRAGRNEIEVRFVPPLVHVRAEEVRLGARPYNGDEVRGEGVRGKWEPFVFMRKPACNFGWDWGPRVATVGVGGGGGGVWIERWDVARIEHVRPLVTAATEEEAQLEVRVDFALAMQPERAEPLPGQPGRGLKAVTRINEREADNPVLRGEAVPGAAGEEPHAVVVLRAPGQGGGGAVVAQGRAALAPGETSVAVRLAVVKPELWWPQGYGPQAADEARPLYELHVEARDGDRVLDTWKGRVGVRTVELDTSRDAWGSALALRVNGRPVFCMGANWIPEGLFAGYAAENVLRQRVLDAAEMNANMLRVWGGGLYEAECFYDECDRRGILVWQDFMFSCGMYPEESPYRELVEREARHQVARLSSHASVALWCGGNETIWGYEKWGWRERVKEGQTWGRGYWLELLPRVCAEVDPSRPYWPNSPWSGVDEPGGQRDVLDADDGDRHTWEVDAWRDGFRAPGSRDGSGVSRFCSEFGQQSPSCEETLREQGVIGAEALSRRQRGPGGDERWYATPLAMVHGAGEAARLAAGRASTEGFAAWLAAVQALQAEAVARGIEWHRVNRPRCGGVLFWQFNDCWAGHSWSAVDAAGRRKPLWDAARRAMSPRLLSIHEVEGSLKLFAVNDTDEAWEGEIVARLCTHGPERTLAEHRALVRVGPRTAGVVADLGRRLPTPAPMTGEPVLFTASAGEASGFSDAVRVAKASA